MRAGYPWGSPSSTPLSSSWGPRYVWRSCASRSANSSSASLTAGPPWRSRSPSHWGDHGSTRKCQAKIGCRLDEPVVRFLARLAVRLEDLGPAVEQAEHPDSGRIIVAGPELDLVQDDSGAEDPLEILGEAGRELLGGFGHDLRLLH